MRLTVHEEKMQPVSNEQIDEKNLRPYKGVTFYKRTGRWEANLWYQNKQHYLGASYTAMEAARAYDKAILYTRSSTQQLNFMPQDYIDDLVHMDRMNFIDYKRYLRVKSRVPNCRIVSESCKGILIDQGGRWEVKYNWKKDDKEKSKMYVFVGWYATEEEALRAYNETAFRYKGPEGLINSFHQKTSKSLKINRSQPRHNLKRKVAYRELAPRRAGSEEPVHEGAIHTTFRTQRFLRRNGINREISPTGTEFEEHVPKRDNGNARPEISPIQVPITSNNLPGLSETQTTVTCEEIHGDHGTWEEIRGDHSTFSPATGAHEMEFSEEPPRMVVDTGFPQLHGTNGQSEWNSILQQHPTQVENSQTFNVEDHWTIQNNFVQLYQTISHSTYGCTGGTDLSHLKRVPPFDVDLTL